MNSWIFDGVGAILVVSLLTWVVSQVYKSVCLFGDSQTVYKWLMWNTRDEFNKSHKSLLEISNGTRLSEERVREVCLKNTKIMQSVSEPGNYSVWRAEPETPVQIFL